MDSSYDVWEQSVSTAITRDVLWRMQVYRLALYLGDLCWNDVSHLMRDRRTISLADQLYRAVGSISANIAEGYSRSSGKDRSRFYEYALGSARESRDWYHKSQYVLGAALAQERIELVAQVIRLILAMLSDQRIQVIRENTNQYITDSSDADEDKETQ